MKKSYVPHTRMTLAIAALLLNFMAFGQSSAPQLVLPILDRFDIKGVHYVPGQDLLVTHGSDEDLKVWRTEDGILLHTIRLDDLENVNGFAMHPNVDKWAAVIYGKVVWIEPQRFDTAYSDFISEEDGLRHFQYNSCVYSNDGKMLYVAGGSYFELAIWRVAPGGSKLERLGITGIGAQALDEKGVDPVSGSRFLIATPDGKALLAGAGPTETWLFNIAARKFQRLSQLDAHHLAQLKDGKVVTANNAGGKSSLKVFSSTFQPLSSATLPFEVTQLVAFPKSSRCLIMSKNGYSLLDVQNGKVEGPFKLPFPAKVAAIHPDEQNFAFAGVEEEKAGLATGQLKRNDRFREFGYGLYQAQKVYSSHDKNLLVLAKGSEGNYRTLQLNQGNLQLRTHPLIDLIKLASLNNNLQGALLRYDGKLVFFNALQPDKQLVFEGLEADYGIELSPLGNYVALLTKNGAFIHDVSKKTQPLYLLTKSGSVDKSPMLYGTFSPDERYFIGSHGLSNQVYGVRCWEVSSGKLIWEIKESSFGHLRFTPDGKEIFCFENGLTECSFRWLDPTNGNTLRRVPLPDIKPSQGKDLKLSFDQSTALIDRKTLYKVNTGSKVGTYQSGSVVYGETLLANGYYAFFVESASDENFSSRIILYDFARNKELAKLYLLEGSDDWALITPEGHYDATPGAMKLMYYRSGFDIIGLDALADRFYFPRLFDHLLRDHRPPSDDDIRKLRRPPVVKLGIPVETRNLLVEDEPAVRKYVVSGENVRLTAEAHAPDGSIKEVKLYQNGKLLRTITRNLVIEEDGKPDKLTTVFDLVLNAGENSIRAVAFNDQGTASQPDEMLITFKPQSGSDTKPKPTLYVLAIGINSYKNARLNLNYALADANAFVETIRNNASGLFQEVNIITLFDNKATRTEIMTSLEGLKTRLKPQDVFVFYYAGHGVLDSKNRYYLVPHNVTQLYGNDQLLESEALNAALLHDFATNLAAQKQVYFLDACQSAGALSAQGAVRGAAEERALAQLARSTGTHWIAASGSEQFAGEFAQLGHGAFTYALLEALRGGAKGSDASVTVKELDAYLQIKVPEITAKYKGTPQYPASFGFGNDFPLGLVKP